MVRYKKYTIFLFFAVVSFAILGVMSMITFHNNSLTKVYTSSQVRLKTVDLFEITGQRDIPEESNSLPIVEITQKEVVTEIPVVKDDSVIYFQGLSELPSPPQAIYYDDVVSTTNFTVILALKFQDLSYLSFLSEIWQSNIIASVFLPDVIDINDVKLILSENSFSKDLILIVRKQKYPNEPFPQSELHNLAIQSCQTTHYLVIEPGLLFHQSFLKSLSYLKLTPDVATILPLFFIQESFYQGTCNHLDCWNNLLKQLPSKKAELYFNYQHRKLVPRLHNSKQHLYLHEDWFLYSNKNLLNVTCFDHLFQQPFLIVQNTHTTPLYPYALDQVSYVELFRLRGYQFQIPINTFSYMINFRNLVKLEQDVFVSWFDTVKELRQVKRVRQCSKKELLLRNEFIKHHRYYIVYLIVQFLMNPIFNLLTRR